MLNIHSNTISSKLKRPIKKKLRKTLDPILTEVLDLLTKMSAKQISDKSGGMIGVATIYNWRKNKVRRPANYTIEGALKAAGYTRKLVKIRL